MPELRYNLRVLTAAFCLIILLGLPSTGHVGRKGVWIGFSHDGKTLGVGDAEVLQLWDVETGRLLWRLKNYGFAHFSSGERSLVATRGAGGTIRFWDVRTGKLSRALGKHRGEVTSVAFRPDDTLAGGDGTGEIRLWNLRTGRLLRTFRRYTGKVSSLEFAPDGKTLASRHVGGKGGFDGTLRLWDSGTGRFLLRMEKALGTVFSPRGERVAAWRGGYDGRIWLWNARTGKLDRVVRTSSACFVTDVRFWDGGNTLAGIIEGCREHFVTSVIWWDVRTSTELGFREWFQAQVGEVMFSPASWIIAVAGREHPDIIVMDVRKAKETSRLLTVQKEGSTPIQGFSSLTFSHDGNLLAAWNSDRRATYIWDANTGQVLHTLSR